ncbi:MAG TPA: methionyl-tRNA formyltransferase [Candidatus Paceibacterota bacterium]|nr:methionyl-tRNA formyltransferase [Candidatus Paceibacterota bacterium]
MKYVFFGTPEFAAIILDGLIRANEPPLAVVCNPDRPVGRKKIIAPPPSKKIVELFNVAPAEAGVHASKKSILILQPEKLDADFQSHISRVKPDFAVVAAYSKIIPKAVIELFPKGIIGVHPSLLPKYRGASPIQSAILGGETETGVTLYMLDEKVDHGPILAQSNLSAKGGSASGGKSQIFPPKADPPRAENLTYIELHDELAKLGGKLLVETLLKFERGEIKPQPQDETKATYTKKFTGQDGFVSESDLQSAQNDNSKKAAEIDRKIRALNPEPGAYTMQNGKRMKLLEATIQNERLMLKKVQEEGGKPRIL